MSFSQEYNSVLTPTNQGHTVRMEIVPYTTTRPHAGRRGSPRIPEGTELFLLRYVHPKGGYYTYSYMDRNDAEQCIANGKLHGTNTEFYMEWNRVFDAEKTMHVFPRSGK